MEHRTRGGRRAGAHRRADRPRVVRSVVVVALWACACQGQGTVGAGSASGAPADALAPSPDAAEPDAAVREPDPEPGPPDPGRVIAELGAIPAWQAVIDRAQLLGRRRQHGVVYGR